MKDLIGLYSKPYIGKVFETNRIVCNSTEDTLFHKLNESTENYHLSDRDEMNHNYSFSHKNSDVKISSQKTESSSKVLEGAHLYFRTIKISSETQAKIPEDLEKLLIDYNYQKVI